MPWSLHEYFIAIVSIMLFFMRLFYNPALSVSVIFSKQTTTNEVSSASIRIFITNDINFTTTIFFSHI